MINNFHSLQKDNKFKILAFIGCVLIIFLRCPELFINPRMSYEEGPFYFSNAFHYSNTKEWFKGLTYINAGYLMLWPNIATTIAANIFPLELAPLITTLFAFVIQIFPIWIVLFGSSIHWETNTQKVLMLSILLFVPISIELWLTTITSQFIFGLIAFLILHSNVDSNKWINRIILVMGGLTGILTCLFTPFFIIKSFVNKSKERKIQAVLLSLCAVIQLYIVLTNSLQRPPTSNILLHNIIWAPMAQSLGYLFLGYHGSSYFFIIYKYALTTHYFIIISSIIIFIFILSVAILTKYSKIKNFDKFTIIGSYFLTLYVSLIGALDYNYIQVGAGTRYFFIPNIILATFLLISVNLKPKNDIRLSKLPNIFLILLIIPIIWGGLKFPNNNSLFNKNYPSWQSEVNKWKKDNNYELQNFPASFQKIKLSKN